MGKDKTVDLLDQLPPQDIDAEQCVLGSLLIDARTLASVRPILRPSHFYRGTHSQIYFAILDVVESEGPDAVDPVVVASFLRQNGKLEEVGGTHFILELMEKVPHALHAEHYARLVAATAAKRRRILLATETLRDSYNGVPVEAIDSRLRRFLDLEQAEHADRRFRHYSIEDIEQLSPPTWYVERHIPAGGLVQLFGDPSSGKSLVALDLAARTTRDDLDWHGYAIEHGHVVFVMAEGHPRKRLDAWQHVNGQIPRDRFHLYWEPVSLLSPDEVARFLLDVRRDVPQGLVAIFLDTFSECFSGGRENDQEHMSIAVRSMNQLREGFRDEHGKSPTVAPIHHTNRQGGERGSSVFRAACDTMIRLQLDEPEIKVTCEKQRDWAHFERKILLTEEVPAVDGICIGRLQVALQSITASMRTLIETARGPLHVKGFSPADLVKTGMSERTAYDALRRCADAGFVKQKAKGLYELTPNGQSLLL